VEDDATNRLVVEALLTHLGVRVSLAEGGAQALAMLEHEPVDLVLMDLRMPGIDGLAACRLRREHERLHGLPPTRIVALTGEALDALRRDCVDAGMDGLLSKPVSLADLESTLAGAGTPAGLSPS
jgi:CheY-like chemotaxis protein